MALLRYANLGVDQPERLMMSAVYGLTDFYKFLKTTKDHLEQSEKQLGWEHVEDDKEAGVWVRLLEVPGQGGDFENDLRQFFDEGVKEVYEAGETDGSAGGSPCPDCKSAMGYPKVTYQTEDAAEEMAVRRQQVYECPQGHGWHLGGINGYPFGKDKSIELLGLDPREEKLLLKRVPEGELLSLRPNTYQIECQMRAIRKLQNEPAQDHLPLLQLFRPAKQAGWERFEPRESVKKWFQLTDEQRPGTDEQRGFVKIALATPDFAFLDGPPGSGKTTAICELIMQLASEGRRVLLCASTHVAVDNVLERLMDKNNAHRDSILPVRIGDKSRVSEKAKPWQLQEFVKTETKRLKKYLHSIESRTKSQDYLLKQLDKGDKTVQRIILDTANLVCGTTIGILQHPSIKHKDEQSPEFDVMIIDEASKTTFQEFLVPALYAKRWILVGDPRQLSPYVDTESMAANVGACFPEEDKYKRNACIDVFQAQENPRNRLTTLVVDDNPEVVEYYKQQAAHREVVVGCEGTSSKDLPHADLVVASGAFVDSNINHLPLDIDHFRGDVPDVLWRRKEAFVSLRREKGGRVEPKTWEAEIAWRMAREYEQRMSGGRDTEVPDGEGPKNKRADKLTKDLEKLYPFDGDGAPDKKGKMNGGNIQEKLETVRRIALPSILESLREGFGKNSRQKIDTILTKGLPQPVLDRRLVHLTHQHRMHPDIADFPGSEIYGGKALITSATMADERAWSYPGSRCFWQHVWGKSKGNSVQQEVHALLRELDSFDKWAKSNPREDGRPWEVAVLTFYRGQEGALRGGLRKWTGQKRANRNFYRGQDGSRYLEIQVCTVDRFQGHEADVVLLSFSNDHPTNFLESANRLNVAITRARYRLVIFGNRNAMKGASGVLGKFAEYMGDKWGTSIPQQSETTGD